MDGARSDVEAPGPAIAQQDVEAAAPAANQPSTNDGSSPAVDDKAAAPTPSGDSAAGWKRTNTYLSHFEVRQRHGPGLSNDDGLLFAARALCPPNCAPSVCLMPHTGGRALQGRLEGVSVVAAVDVVPVRGGGAGGRVPGVCLLRLVREPTGRID